jgi:hypothetical protein
MFADTITGSSTAGASTFTPVTTPITGTGVWQSNAINPYGANGNGNPFWNNPSDDSFGTGTGNTPHLANVGYLLTDSGAFATTSIGHPLGTDTLSGDYQNTDGTDPTSFNFVRTLTSETITMLFADGGLDTGATPTSTNQYTQIGWYTGTSYTGSNGTVLYNSVADTTTVGSAVAFNPTGTYGFFAIVCYGGANNCETYTTNGNSGAFGALPWDHFAAFSTAAGNTVIGFTAQNGLFGEAEGDFQDVVFEVNTVSPEPGTIAIMGLGLAGLGVLGRRRFNKK